MRRALKSNHIGHDRMRSMSTATTLETPAAGRWSMLALLCLAVVLSFSCWFSANAIAPELKRAWSLSENAARLAHQRRADRLRDRRA
jgi:hypothetical protein